jgi:hypothetical protein
MLLTLAIASTATALHHGCCGGSPSLANGRGAARKIVRATFTEEPLFADVRVNIFAIPQLLVREHLTSFARCRTMTGGSSSTGNRSI